MIYVPASEEDLHYLCSKPGVYFTLETERTFGMLYCGYKCASCKFDSYSLGCRAETIDKTHNQAYYVFIQNYYPELLI